MDHVTKYKFSVETTDPDLIATIQAGDKFKMALSDYSQILRAATKHAEYKTEEASDVAEHLRDEFWRVLRDYSVDIE